ncbi:TGFBI [Branchiostoma lanceolatum]|uniref:TGFBI protein n=1 Tax=Branchiostoma lanceolatum TaxID=7740 RepID=A0A8K0F3H4_BRALA|nr:TGFBI [Branchiostoma lanceolatum]
MKLVLAVLSLACVANAQWPLTIIDVLEKVGNETTLISLTKQAGLYNRLNGLVEWTNDKLIPTVGGPNIRINVYDISRAAITLTANGAGVVNPDCHAIAGFVQVIDLVMYPLPNGTIVSEITSNNNLSTLATAVSKAGLVATLSAVNGNFTVFAPTNKAFSKLPAGVLDGLLKNVTALTNLLTYHVISDVYNNVGLYYSSKLKTVQGTNVTIKASSRESIMVNNATVLAEISTTNGVLHVIDTVLIPPTMHFELVHNKSL